MHITCQVQKLQNNILNKKLDSDFVQINNVPNLYYWFGKQYTFDYKTNPCFQKFLSGIVECIIKYLTYIIIYPIVIIG